MFNKVNTAVYRSSFDNQPYMGVGKDVHMDVDLFLKSIGLLLFSTY